MLKAFLISVIFCESIAIASVLVDVNVQGAPRTAEATSTVHGESEYLKSPNIICDPICHSYTPAHKTGWWRRVSDRFSDDPVAWFTIFLSVSTALLAIITGLTLRHSHRTERAYVSGGGYFPYASENLAERVSRRHRSEYFSLRVNNYGKTPAYVTRVEIGFCSDEATLPERPTPCRIEQLGATVPQGKESLPTDINLHRIRDIGAANTIIFGTFYYEDIFRRCRHSGFILRITEHRMVLPLSNPPRAYVDWT